jgi:hypothetical protein
LADGDPYILLSGTDASVAGGCCPSPAVTEAFRLVKAGVLLVHQRPLPSGACPIHIFALSGEMTIVDGSPVFTKSEEIRQALTKNLASPTKNPVSWRFVLGVLLLAIIAALLSIGIVRRLNSVPLSWEKVLQIESGFSGRVLVLTRSSLRCPLCETLEAGAKKALEGQTTISLKELPVDAPALRDLALSSGADINAALIILDVRQGKVVQARALKQVYAHISDPKNLSENIRAELQ